MTQKKTNKKTYRLWGGKEKRLLFVIGELWQLCYCIYYTHFSRNTLKERGLNRDHNEAERHHSGVMTERQRRPVRPARQLWVGCQTASPDHHLLTLPDDTENRITVARHKRRWWPKLCNIIFQEKKKTTQAWIKMVEVNEVKETLLCCTNIPHGWGDQSLIWD